MIGRSGALHAGIRSASVILLLSLAALQLGDAAPLAAQSCLGRGVGGLAARAVVAEAARVEYRGAAGSGADAGAGYWANPGGPIAYSVGYARRLLDGADPHIARGKIAFEFGAPPRLPPGAGVCITGGVQASLYDEHQHNQSWRIVSVPLGAALGLVIPVSRTTRIYPFIHPSVSLSFHDTRHYGSPETPGSDGELYTGPLPHMVLEVGAGFARGPVVGRLRFGGTHRPVDEAKPPIPDLRAALEMGIRF